MSPLLAIVGIFWSLYYTVTFSSPRFHGFYDKPSLVLLLIMPPSIMLLSHTLKDFSVGLTILYRALFRAQNRLEAEVIEALTASSAMVRAEGIGALMRIRDKVQYPLLKDGFALILNDFSNEEI